MFQSVWGIFLESVTHRLLTFGKHCLSMFNMFVYFITPHGVLNLILIIGSEDKRISATDIQCSSIHF